MRTLRRIVGAPFGVPAFRWMLEPAMWLLRTEPELVLKSRWVVPERLTAAGFVFAHRDLEEALRASLASAARAAPAPASLAMSAPALSLTGWMICAKARTACSGVDGWATTRSTGAITTRSGVVPCTATAPSSRR
ncbi:DUF1731 domain-containing protein [Microbacterium sp. B24]|uniref:DUF1731 domain-containing protein n=1 Tax=Microbacterium sp. B24 TaxID=95616 RepID=UPI0035B4FB10